jgi:hypothetical protein
MGVEEGVVVGDGEDAEATVLEMDAGLTWRRWPSSVVGVGVAPAVGLEAVEPGREGAGADHHRPAQVAWPLTVGVVAPEAGHHVDVGGGESVGTEHL